MKPEEYFYLRNGNTLKSIKEFYDSLEIMSDDDFSFHVNDEKNDFANWVRGVFKEKELAEKLFAVKTKDETKKVLKEFLEPSKEKTPKKIVEPASIQESKELLDVYLNKELEKVRTQYGIPSKKKVHKKEVKKKQESQEKKEKHLNIFSKLLIKIKTSKILGKTILRKSYVDNELKELDNEIEDFHEEVEEKLGEQDE
ncbi:MAG: hypothetical protein ISS25_00430 [Nanoarchaeota archaeon]|nr:hypothetical protein [DPANN group archaeon]MBL7116283.1 hypothetical protein [Nanoarchaeota archaeon]